VGWMGEVATLLSLRPIRNAFLLRTLLIWCAVRLALASGGVGNPELGTELLVAAVVSGLVLLDARRRAEDVLLGNLGISAWSVVLLALPAAILLEVLVP
jgi:hypothetical protein